MGDRATARALPLPGPRPLLYSRPPPSPLPSPPPIYPPSLPLIYPPLPDHAKRCYIRSARILFRTIYLFVSYIAIPSPPPFRLVHIFSDAFPVLVEIAASAFQDFAGRIQFTENPFPALQSIGAKAFSGCSSFKSMIELMNQPELKTLHEMVFEEYGGGVVLSGALPKLEVIGFEAFRGFFLEGSKLHADVAQAVILKDLPLLKRIGKNAFKNFLGNVSVQTDFPSLEFIGEAAFSNVQGSSVSFELPFGAPALRCVGPRAFGLTQWGGQFVMAGDFPCLLAQDRVEGSEDMTFNAGDDMFENSVDIFVDMAVHQCKPGGIGWCTETEAACNSIHGFANIEYCAYINLQVLLYLVDSLIHFLLPLLNFLRPLSAHQGL